jgi:hypothetical protein
MAQEQAAKVPQATATASSEQSTITNPLGAGVAAPQFQINAIPAPVDYRKHWGLTERDYPIMVTLDYAVYLDKDGDLEWETKEEFDKEMRQRLKPEELNGVLNRAAVLRSYPVEHLSEAQRKSFWIMVGEGLARAFEFDPRSALQMFANAGDYGMARNHEVARGWYLSAAGLCAGLFAIVLFLGWEFREEGSLVFGEKALYTGLAACAGAFGAFFSISRRVARAPLDPSAGRRLHWIEGIARIFVGVLGAIIALLAVKAGLVLTVLGDKGFPGLFLIAFVAGFSESLVTTIIKRVEINTETKREKTET